MQELLPIGSVVLLKDGIKKIMIMGYMAMEKKDSNKIYDYCGCIYPEGLLSSEQSLLFYHQQIEQVYFEGYKGEEYTLFQTQLEEIQKQLEKTNESIDTLE
ncbi:MAG: DUF4176 domain-containing protein [Bacilli bacterium]|nr:DUF4176 domain-containing protein [Bacilli bacterium]